MMNLLDIGCLFDWITPTVGYINDIAHGGAATFTVHPHVDGKKIEKILFAFNISSWDYRLYDYGLMFNVPAEHAQATYDVFVQQGIANVLIAIPIGVNRVIL